MERIYGMRVASLGFLFATAILDSSCAVSRFHSVDRIAFVVVAGEKVSFPAPELTQEQEIVVFVGHCLSQELAAVTERFDRVVADRSQSDPTAHDAELSDLFAKRQEMETRPVHARMLAQSLVLEDVTVVPRNNLGFTAFGSLQTNSRYVFLRVEFPDDGDVFEAIVDVSRGRFVVFDRYGSSIHLSQGRSRPIFM